MECINATSLHRKSGQWGTQRLLPHSQFAYGGTKAGCPIQAVLWLEWDTTALAVPLAY